MSAMTVIQAHPFSPATDGSTCNVMQYPAYKRCGKGPGAKVHDGTRPEPPELEFPYPPCSMCGEDTYHDGDGFCCDPCGAHWGSQPGPGSWIEPDACTWHAHRYGGALTLAQIRQALTDGATWFEREVAYQ